MKVQVYAVADSGIQAYMPPFYARARGEALRAFTQLVNNRDTNVNKYPHQFELVYLGEFDDVTGLFECKEPEHVVDAVGVFEPFTPETELTGRGRLDGPGRFRGVNGSVSE